MNKNIIIGILVVLLVGLGGYYLIGQNKNNLAGNTNTPADTTNDTESPASTNTVANPAVADAPTVQTSTNVSVSSSTAVVTGSVRPNGPATTYWFEYGEFTSLGYRTASYDIGSGYVSTATPGYITGLKANTSYYFRLSAKNRIATVNGETYSFKTNDNPPPAGIAPTVRTNSATDINRTGANLNGQINPSNAQTNYWFEYGKDVGFGYLTSVQTLASGNSTVPATISISGLDPVAKYYFRLIAQNQYGTTSGPVLNFITLGPPAPTAPSLSTNQATSITKVSATLNGQVNPNRDETTYWFEYSEDSLLGTLIGGGTPVAHAGNGAVSVKVKADISSLKSNTKYFYRVVARNSLGTTKGDIVSFRTKN